VLLLGLPLTPHDVAATWITITPARPSWRAFSCAVEWRWTLSSEQTRMARRFEYTKEQIREMLPPSACRSCVRFVQRSIGLPQYHYCWKNEYCTRCGIPIRQIMMDFSLGNRDPWHLGQWSTRPANYFKHWLEHEREQERQRSKFRHPDYSRWLRETDGGRDRKNKRRGGEENNS
jgi:hypothetical protein